MARFVYFKGDKATNISQRAEISKEVAKKGEELARKMNVCFFSPCLHCIHFYLCKNAIYVT